MPGLAARALIGAVLAGAVAALAYRGRSLSANGALAAVGLGAACAAAGVGWAMLLLAFFLSGTGLSRFKAGLKASRMSGVVEKGGARDAWQVLANGAPFALAAIGQLIFPWPGWQTVGAAAIAASTSDTWSTEIGALSATPPRSMVSGKVVAAGTSGGITWVGSGAAMAGALFTAGIVLAMGWPNSAACAAVAGGFGGAMVDSLLGATIQRRRWCDGCGMMTERAVHICGTTTRDAGGLRWLGNDAVNAISSVAGASIGLYMFSLTRSAGGA